MVSPTAMDWNCCVVCGCLLLFHRCILLKLSPLRSFKNAAQRTLLIHYYFLPLHSIFAKQKSVVEQTQATECHGHAEFIAGFNHLCIADRTAGLHNGAYAAAVGALDIIAEGEERI